MAGLHGISPVTEIDSLAYIMLFFSAVAAFWLPNTNELFLSSGNRDDMNSRSLSLFRANWSPNLRWGLAVGLVFALCLLSIEQTNEFIYAQF